MNFPPFPGFRSQGLTFLRELAAHNERPWFKEHKDVFDDELWWPMQCLIADVTRQAQQSGLPLMGDPKRSLFRIYRDTRFSKNKAPYKTHLGGVWSRSGSRKEPGGVYVHVEPGNSFVAAGYWRPDGPLLRAWRTRMSDDPSGFLDMQARLSDAGLDLANRESLKRMPRGLQHLANHPIAPYLRWKSFITSRPVSDEALSTPAFTADVLRTMQDARPLLEYGWLLVDDLQTT